MTDTADALTALAALPGVPEAVDAAREACTRLRWHNALRRRTEEARAESGVRAARASAALAGARFPVAMIRDAARGAATLPDDPTGRTASGALRAAAEATRLDGVWSTAPMQALARLHTAAAAGLVPDEALGRPRRAGEAPGDGADLLTGAAPGDVVPAPDGGDPLTVRLDGLADLLRAPAEAPALVVAALVHAEVMTARPFVVGNGVVARALCRAVVRGRGLDPTGVAVWEVPLLVAGPSYPLTLARYAAGTADGVRDWLVLFAQAVVDGAAEGGAVCDAILAGRLTPAG
ncbi:Fic family protein [Kineosporia sp. R_H_3]|uniref:Fic family protein n=1 Tax=Kineosporia sp. R_H_3 TaxID=1961848 RepID=UPI000B4B537E|nr:Fic family protein [Kineosporia sp. R_H_3]